MQVAVAAVFLTILVALFAGRIQEALQRWFAKKPRRVFAVPLLLTGFCAAVLWLQGALSLWFLLLLSAYTFVPAILVYANHNRGGRRRWLDFAAILLLWLPVEFMTGKELLPAQVWAVANTIARGTAVTSGLLLFLVFRSLPGMKYNLPRTAKDFLVPVLGFLIAAPVLILLGLKLSFLGPFRILPGASVMGFARTFFVTLAGVAIPEELLFRALIQNWLMQTFGCSDKVLLVAALIFGAAHLNNGPGALPNWRYMVLATIAGFVYGKVFQKSSTILSSAGLHALVNTARRTFFD